MDRWNWLALATVVALAASGCNCGKSVFPDGPDAGEQDGGAGDPDGGPDDAGTSTCGDGTSEGAEGCDDGAQNSDVDPDACRTDCQPARCGDSVVDYGRGEQCDDGNTAQGDGCGADCRIEAATTCGDGALDLDLGEQCDDGNAAAGDGCDPQCQFEKVGGSCGDASQDPGEVCDDGNTANGDACNPTCNLANAVTHFTGRQGQTGTQDGAPANARFGGATATLAVDDQYLWVADTSNHRLRRVEIATGNVLTVAGTGNAGNADNANGLQASFTNPNGIATDGKTVWVGSGRRIRAIGAAGPFPVTTVAGSGVQGAQDGVGAAASFDDIRGLTYYDGFVYLLDAAQSTLRRLDPVTGEVVTLAGAAGITGSLDGVGQLARFQSPRYMASDNSGNLFIVDTNGNLIRVYNTVTGHVGTLVGGPQGYTDGVGTQAQLHRPRGITSDGTSLYIVEFVQHTVRQVVVQSKSVSTLAGQHCSGMATCAGGYTNATGMAARFSSPWDLAYHWPSRSLFVYDGANFVVRRIQ